MLSPSAYLCSPMIVNIKSVRTRMSMQVMLLFIMFAPVMTFGQSSKVSPADAESIDSIINAYYEAVSGPAGGTVDVERDRYLHHPDAWVAIAGTNSTGERSVNIMALADYHGDNQPRAEAFWEWETAREVKRSGNMVHVWSSYSSARSPQGEPYTGGVNSITLFHDGDRWWIMGWMFDAAAGPAV